MVLLLQYTLIFSSVLILVALGGCFAEHSGVINLGLEGIMVLGALGGALVMRYFGDSISGAALVLLVLLVVLGVTSFAFVKRQMSTASWKKVQKLAYPFFGLVYVHLLLMLLPSALHGGLAAQASVVVYSVVFVGYALCRVGRALVDRSAEDAVSASNDLTPAISDEPEMVS